MNVDRYVLNCFEKIKEKVQSLENLNILVMGKTGVGKSTLINTVLSQDLAFTGQGQPITQKMEMYSKPNFPLRIYDTKGLELGKEAQKEVKDEIFSTIKQQNKLKNVSESIHCILYCINANGDRIEEEELEWLRVFTDESKTTNVPVIIVLTKAMSTKQSNKFADWIKDQNLAIDEVVPVLASDYEFDEDNIKVAYGLSNLFDTMQMILPDKIVETFLNVQQNDIKEKKKKSIAIVNTTASVTAAQGAIPIPFADAALLIPTQVTMLTSISVIFGMKLDEGILTTLVSSVLGCSGATLIGKGLANGLKAIPVVGTTFGGAISGGTAFAVTNGLGRAYVKLMVMIAEGKISVDDLQTDKGQEIFKKLYKSKD